MLLTHEPFLREGTPAHHPQRWPHFLLGLALPTAPPPYPSSLLVRCQPICFCLFPPVGQALERGGQGGGGVSRLPLSPQPSTGNGCRLRDLEGPAPQPLSEGPDKSPRPPQTWEWTWRGPGTLKGPSYPSSGISSAGGASSVAG